MIPCKQIKSITKEKTARVIPNAIQINTHTDKYFFCSFASRDKSYLMMFRVWQNILLEKVGHVAIVCARCGIGGSYTTQITL